MHSQIDIKEVIKPFNFLCIFLKLIYIFQMVKPAINECKEETPILFNNDLCILQYCNEQNKTHRMCNLILIGDKDFSYVNLANYSNGDLIVETSSKGSGKRKFYGIKNNGREFFKTNDPNKRTYYYSLQAKDQTGNNNNQRLEAEIFIATINEGVDKGKEYLVSIGKDNAYTELYDFENDQIYQNYSQKFLNRQMNNIRGTVIYYQLNNFKYILFGYINSYDYIFYIQKFKFKTIDIENNNPKLNYYYNTAAVGKTLSCFMTDSKLIICFYTYIKNYFSKEVCGYIKVIKNIQDNINFEEIEGTGILIENTMNDDESAFLKAIHYKGEIGIFIYYYIISNGQKPKILFKKYNNGFSDYSDNFKETILDYKTTSVDCSLNDLIKISDKKLCFLSTSNAKDILYIALIDIFGTEKLIIRYYEINVLNLYNFKFAKSIRAHLYNDFIAFAFDFCRQDKNSENYSGFMIFNYPNGTDTNLNVTDYLLRNNNIDINNIIINLINNTFIENNIFRYAYSQVQVTNISGCDNINLFSSTNDNIKITNNYILNNNENIKLKFVKYSTIQCVIEYAYFVTDHSYAEDLNEISQKYVKKVGIDNRTSYDSHKGKYKGKSIYYNIILEKELESNCEKDNCLLCLKDKISYCITCKENFTLFEIGDKIENKT